MAELQIWILDFQIRDVLPVQGETSIDVAWESDERKLQKQATAMGFNAS